MGNGEILKGFQGVLSVARGGMEVRVEPSPGSRWIKSAAVTIEREITARTAVMTLQRRMSRSDRRAIRQESRSTKELNPFRSRRQGGGRAGAGRGGPSTSSRWSSRRGGRSLRRTLAGTRLGGAPRDPRVARLCLASHARARRGVATVMRHSRTMFLFKQHDKKRDKTKATYEGSV